MKRPELLEATASEPLSFEEELEMQRESDHPGKGDTQAASSIPADDGTDCHGS